MIRRSLGTVYGVLCTALLACGTTTEYVPPGPADHIIAYQGSNQQAEPGTTLPQLLMAKVVDSAGAGVPRVHVTWLVTRGTGTVVHPGQSTDIGGKVTAELALGNRVGDVQVRVQAVDDTTVFGYFVAYAAYPGDTTITPPAAIEATVGIGDDFFAPISVTIHAGNAVKWEWHGQHPHNVVVTGTQHGAFPARLEARVTGEGTITFPNPGEWTIWCSEHQSYDDWHTMIVYVR